jgi:dTDP-4-dehydrorhamnose 3,5-epimerase
VKVSATPLEGVLLIETRVFPDARGWFTETYQRDRYAQHGIPDLVQDNASSSTRGVLRGMHYQLKQPQGKLVQVISGEVFDVAVDIRPSSSTFKKWFGVRLSGENYNQLWVPPGFAHGFLTLSDTAVMTYKCSALYDPTERYAIRWNDPAIGIEWPLEGAPILSAGDADAPLIAEATLPA